MDQRVGPVSSYRVHPVSNLCSAFASIKYSITVKCGDNQPNKDWITPNCRGTGRNAGSQKASVRRAGTVRERRHYVSDEVATVSETRRTCVVFVESRSLFSWSCGDAT